MHLSSYALAFGPFPAINRGCGVQAVFAMADRAASFIVATWPQLSCANMAFETILISYQILSNIDESSNRVPRMRRAILPLTILDCDEDPSRVAHTIPINPE